MGWFKSIPRAIDAMKKAANPATPISLSSEETIDNFLNFRQSDFIRDNERLNAEHKEIINRMKSDHEKQNTMAQLNKSQEHTVSDNTMTRQEYIAAIRNGEYCIENDDRNSTLALLKEIFTRDTYTSIGMHRFYYSKIDTDKWYPTDNKPMKSIKASTLANMKDETVIKVTPENAQRIINIACNTWKTQLAALWSKSIVLNQTIEISQLFYQEMRSACTEQQHTLFDEIFGTDAPEFKVGDFIVVNDFPDKILKMKRFNANDMMFEDLNGDSIYYYNYLAAKDIRHATPEEIRTAQYPPDGTPCWVSVGGTDWVLRYSNGKGAFYDAQRKSGTSSDWDHIRPFDPNNLPFNT